MARGAAAPAAWRCWQRCAGPPRGGGIVLAVCIRILAATPARSGKRRPLGDCHLVCQLAHGEPAKAVYVGRDAATSHELGGRVDLMFELDGVVCLIVSPLGSARGDRFTQRRCDYVEICRAARSCSSTIGFCKTAATLSGDTGKVA